MTTPNSRRRKIFVRTAIPLLAISFWGLGDVKRSYWIQDSPDRRFSTSLVENRGWNSLNLKAQYFIYVTDNHTGESILATRNVVYCGLEKIALNNITWDKGNRRFSCLWTIQGYGFYRQQLRVSHYASKRGRPVVALANPSPLLSSLVACGNSCALTHPRGHMSYHKH